MADENLKVRISADISNFSSSINKMSSEIRGISKNFNGLEKLGNGMVSVGKSLTAGLTLPLVGVGVASSKLAMDFEQSFAKVSTLLDESSTDFGKYQTDIKKASKEMGVGVNDFNEALYQSISAGVDAGDAIQFTSDMVKLAKGGFTDTTTAVDLATTVMNSFGDKAGDTTSIMDKLIQTQNLGKTTVGELGSSLGTLIPIANGANVSFDTMLASMAELTAGGIKTAEASTYLKSMINELSKSSTGVAKILKEQTGSSFSELMEKGVPLTDVLGTLKEYADKNGLAFGDLFGSIEASTSAVALMTDGGEGLASKLNEIAGASGTANSAFEKVEDTAGAKLSKAFNSLKISMIEIGGALAPLIEKFAEFVTKIADWIAGFGNLNPSTQMFILAIAGLLAILPPLLTIVGTCIGLFASLTTIATVLNVGMLPLVGTILAIIAGISLLVAGGIWLCQNWETVKAFASSCWEGIKTIVVGVCEGIASVCSAIWTGIQTIVTTVWNAIKVVISAILEGIKAKIIYDFNNMKATVSAVSNAIKSVVTTVWNGIKTVFSSVGNAIKSTVTNVFNGIKSTVTKVMNTIKNTVQSAWNTVKSIFDKVLKPNIKMPKFSITGKFSINPPSVPKLGKKKCRLAM